uniref:Peptidylglycine alpha-amidating monooxygenase n=1 Tax=Cynoglossus semilaevis TaxID=244447 RepID=A0A3P8WQG2_CYNSE
MATAVMRLPVFCVMVLAFMRHSHGWGHQSKRSQEDVLLDPYSCVSRTKQPLVIENPDNFSMDIRMPGVVPKTSDTYLCMAFPVPTSQDVYIVDFIPHASMDTVHHMILFGCQRPVSTSNYWDCGSSAGTCKDESSIKYAWARDAPPTKLPKDVGFKVGRKSGSSYFVLQVHYGDVSAFRDHHRDCSGLSVKMTSKPQPFIAGIYLLMSVDTVILPGKRVTNADIACDYSSYPIYPFAFRTHTHHLGKVVTGYRIRKGKWSLIGRQSPQLPQAFYPANKDVDVKYGDTLAARCMFSGEGRTSNTYIGGTSADEMCNFYIMYYMDSKHAIPYMSCMETGSEELFQNIPAEASIPIPVSPGHSMMHMGSSKDHEEESSHTHENNREQDEDNHLEQVSSWPQESLQLGQVSGLAVDSNSNLVIFHRGDRHWGAESFNSQAQYQERFLGPIQQSTILVVDPNRGNILKASGRNMFYLPHGITTDEDNNYWVTDVALHQVFKVTGDGRERTLLTLGEAFTPGSDSSHFCKPTDVAVDTKTGNIFVSDGYCNARILKFSADGRYLTEWGAGSSDRRRRLPFRIPHSLVFLPDRQEVCVADRENGRIQCFIAETGEFVKEIKKDEFGGSVFAINYSPAGDGLIFAVNGQSSYLSIPLKGFVINYSTKDILDTFAPNTEDFVMPHDIVETQEGSVFVGDVGTQAVFKFTDGKSHHSVKKGDIEVQQLEEMETFIQTKTRPGPNASKMAVVKEKQLTAQQPPRQEQQSQSKEEVKVEEMKEKSAVKTHKDSGVFPVVMTTLLLVPLLLVISIGLFVCYRRNHQSEVKTEPTTVGGILGKIRGKAVGSLNLEIEESLNCLKTTFVFLKDNGTDSQTDSVRACDSRRTADDDSHDLPCQNLPGNSGDENTNLSSTNVFSFGRPNSFNPTIMSEKFSFVCQNQQVPTERQSSPATTVNAEPWEKRNNFHKRFSINQFWDIPPPQEFADISGNIMEEQRNVSSLSKNSQDNHMTFNGTHNGESTEDRGDLTSSPDQFSESDNYSLFARTSLSTNRSSFTQEFINSQRRRSWIRNNSIDTVEHRGCPLPMKRRQTFPGMLGGPGSMQEDLLLPCAESFSSLNMCSSRRENVEEIRQTLERLSDISSETEDSPKPASERRDRKQLVLSQFCSLSSEVAPEDVFSKQSPSLGNVTYHCEDLQQRFKDMDHLDIGGREYKAEHSEVEDSGFDQEMVETDHHNREQDSKDSGGQTFSIHVIPPSCSGSEEQMLESQTVQLIPNDLLQDQSVLAAPEDKSSVMTLGSLEHRFLQMDIRSTTSSQMEKATAEDTHVSVPQDGHAESPDKGAKASSEKEDSGSSQQTTAEEKKDQGRFSRRSTRAEIHTREQLSRSLTDRQLKCSSLEVKEHLKPLMHKDVETSSGSDHWARRRKLFKESKQWSSAGGSSVTSDITEESVSEESPSVDMTVRDNEDGGFYMETFHSSTWIYQGDNLGPEVIPSSLNTRTRASASEHGVSGDFCYCFLKENLVKKKINVR